jgi:hypothetical protein
VATWHSFLLLLQWCFVLPLQARANGHKEI